MENIQELYVEVADFKDVIRRIPKEELPVIAIYNNPSDIPGKVVARLFGAGSKGSRPTRYIAVRENLNDIRTTIPNGMVCFERCEADDPAVVETWL